MDRGHRPEPAVPRRGLVAARRSPRCGSRQKTPGRWVTHASSTPVRSMAASSASGEVPGTRRKGYAPRKALTSMRISRRERRRREDARGVAPADQLELGRREEVLQVAQLGPAGLDREIAAPEQPLDADRLEARLEHAAVHAAAGEIHEDVGEIAQRRQRVEPVAAAADMGQDEAAPSGGAPPARPSSRASDASCPAYSRRRCCQMWCRIGTPPLGGQPADRVEQRIVGPAAGGQLDADHARRRGSGGSPPAACVGVVRIDGDVAADAAGMLRAAGRAGSRCRSGGRRARGSRWARSGPSCPGSTRRGR